MICFPNSACFLEEDDEAQSLWTTAKRRRRGGQSSGAELRGARTGRPPFPRWVGGLDLEAGLCAAVPQGQEPLFSSVGHVSRWLAARHPAVAGGEAGCASHRWPVMQGDRDCTADPHTGRPSASCLFRQQMNRSPVMNKKSRHCFVSLAGAAITRRHRLGAVNTISVWRPEFRDQGVGGRLLSASGGSLATSCSLACVVFPEPASVSRFPLFIKAAVM